MTDAVRGPALAFLLFAGFFALHIVAGATDQGWLFAIAVLAIFATAAAFPLISLAVGRPRAGLPTGITLGVGCAAGAALMAGTLWAANDRSWAWWTVPGAGAIAVVASLAAPRIIRAGGRT